MGIKNPKRTVSVENFKERGKLEIVKLLCLIIFLSSNILLTLGK